MRGRKPLPTSVRLLRGNPGKRAIPSGEPKPEAKIPPAPRTLDKLARAEWRRMSKLLFRMGLLSELDRAAFAAYCVCWSQWIQAMEKVQTQGAVLKAPSGYPVQNPYLAVANRALRSLHVFLVEFGLTPSSRSRIDADPPDIPGDNDESFLFGRESA